MKDKTNDLLDTIKGNRLNSFRDSATKDYAQKSYLEDSIKLIRFLLIFTFACHIISSFLASSWCVTFFNSIININISQAALSVIVYLMAATSVSLIEVGKNRSMKASFVSWYRDGRLSPSVIIAAVFLVASGLLSFGGGGELGVKYTPVKATTDISEIRAFYGDQIKAANEQISSIQKNELYLWKGRLTKKGTKAAAAVEGRLTILTASMNEAISQATASNNTTSLSNDTKTANYSLMAAAVAVIIDLLNLLLYGYIERSRYLIFVEASEGSGQPPKRNRGRDNINRNQQGNQAPANGQTGYQFGKQKDGENGRRGNHVSKKRRSRGYEITCINCGEDAIRKSPKAIYCGDACKREMNVKRGSQPNGL